MKYQNIAAYSIKGLAQQQVESDKEIVFDSKSGFRAILTSNPDIHCFKDDQNRAVSRLMLSSIFDFDKLDTFEEQLADEIKEIQKSRKQSFGTGLYLVCLTEGSVDKFEPSCSRETDDFMIYIDEVLKESINLVFEPHVFDVLSALVISTDSVLAFVKVSSSLTFFRDDDKPVYSHAFTGSLTPYIPRTLTPDMIKSVGDWYKIMISTPDLDRVKKLLVASLQNEGDKMRSFLSAWTALEVFINKTFTSYEKQFFKELSNGKYPSVQNQYLERIQIVMKDKYRLVDKFSLITSLLSPKSADEDMKFFKTAKDKRDKLSHGQDLVEAALPVEEVQKLARKYLQLHLAN